MKLHVFIIIGFLTVMNAGNAFAACSNPSGAAGDQMYNSTHNVMQFCDGTHWTAMKGDGTGGAETDPQVNTLTGGRWCKANGAGTLINCTQTAPVLSETDPQVNTLTGGRWCKANAAGTLINCTQTAPVLSETDPQVASVTNGRICKGNGSAMTCNVSIATCTGSTKVLQWNGSAFTCATIN